MVLWFNEIVWFEKGDLNCVEIEIGWKNIFRKSVINLIGWECFGVFLVKFYVEFFFFGNYWLGYII